MNPLDALLDDPAQAGLFTDFDGTLAPIVDDPESVEPLPGAVDVLARLAPRMGVVGVISGRPVDVLLRHLGAADLQLFGLHGLERAEGGQPVARPDAEEWRAAIDEAAAGAERELAGVADVERKGLAITIHYRRNPTGADETRRWAEQTAESTGLGLHPARMSYELRPPVPHGKGVTLESAAKGLRAACFFGDDWGDADAFDALDRLADGGVRTVRIGVRSEEAPDELLERADVVVDGPEGVVAMLEALADQLSV